MKLPNRMGSLLLGIWLIAMGAIQLVPAINFSGSAAVLAVLALLAGILILIER